MSSRLTSDQSLRLRELHHYVQPITRTTPGGETATVWHRGESGDHPVGILETVTKMVSEREKIPPARRRGVGTGKKFPLLARNGRFLAILGVLGEFCTGLAKKRQLLGEFCTGIGSGCGTKFSLLARNGQFSLILGVLGEFCTGCALR